MCKIEQSGNVKRTYSGNCTSMCILVGLGIEDIVCNMFQYMVKIDEILKKLSKTKHCGVDRQHFEETVWGWIVLTF